MRFIINVSKGGNVVVLCVFRLLGIILYFEFCMFGFLFFVEFEQLFVLLLLLDDEMMFQS